MEILQKSFTNAIFLCYQVDYIYMGIETINGIEARVLEYKRHIHANPETGWKEIGTTAYIQEQLDAASIIEGMGENKTGVALVVGSGPENIFVRADIDALPMTNGPQHACGHSTHTAALMGGYHWLKDHEHQLSANNKRVTFVFQPAEETYPSGARTFLDTHPEIFQDCQYGFGIHVQPRLPVGDMQIDDGMTWAANDHIQVEVHGFTAHIKDTPNGIDAIDGASQVVRMFRQFQQTFENFGSEVVFNFNTIQGGVANNCIADRTLLKGGIRWLRREDQQRIKEFFRELPAVLQQTYPGSVEVRYIEEVPPGCKNDAQLAQEISQYMAENTDFNIIRNGKVSLGVEDFAWYTQHNRTLFSHIGTGCEYDLHDPRMVVSDEATLRVYEYWRNIMQWWITQG